MYTKEAPNTIQSMFNRIAKRYDLTNAALSFFLHRYWNQRLIQAVSKNKSPFVLLDLCSGTGDIAFGYLKKNKQPTAVTCVDFSSNMLDIAKEKAKKDTRLCHFEIAYIEADVQYLPLGDDYADAATMAYGLRNVKDPLLSIKEAFRVLKPGGTFAILELTRPRHPLLRISHKLYLKTVIPFLGKWLTPSKEAYDYLCNSIQSFLSPDEVKALMCHCGFLHVKCQPISFGIATLITGQKPE